MLGVLQGSVPVNFSFMSFVSSLMCVIHAMHSVAMLDLITGT